MVKWDSQGADAKRDLMIITEVALGLRKNQTGGAIAPPSLFALTTSVLSFMLSSVRQNISLNWETVNGDA